MKITKRQLRGIIREEVNRALNEYQVPAPTAERRHNNAPPSDSNWRDFADSMDIGVLDLEGIGYALGFDSFYDLDTSISPRHLMRRDPPVFVDAVKSHSLKAEDMSDEQIMAAADPMGY